MCCVRADAFYALRMLPKQLAVLQASEEDTRQVCTVFKPYASVQFKVCCLFLSNMSAGNCLLSRRDT